MDVNTLIRIRRSYAQLAPYSGWMTWLLYDQFFQRCPETRGLFAHDLETQRRHFSAALALIVRNVAYLDTLEAPLHELGHTHAQSGVLPSHYTEFCEALIDAMSQTLGDSWSDELTADWRCLLEKITHHMLSGVRDPNT